MIDDVKEHLADRGFTAEPICLMDLERSLPPGALPKLSKSGHWRTLGYQTDTLSGTMLVAGPETAAPEVIYHLEVCPGGTRFRLGSGATTLRRE